MVKVNVVFSTLNGTPISLTPLYSGNSPKVGVKRIYGKKDYSEILSSEYSMDTVHMNSQRLR